MSKLSMLALVAAGAMEELLPGVYKDPNSGDITVDEDAVRALRAQADAENEVGYGAHDFVLGGETDMVQVEVADTYAVGEVGRVVTIPRYNFDLLPDKVRNEVYRGPGPVPERRYDVPGGGAIPGAQGRSGGSTSRTREAEMSGGEWREYSKSVDVASTGAGQVVSFAIEPDENIQVDDFYIDSSDTGAKLQDLRAGADIVLSSDGAGAPISHYASTNLARRRVRIERVGPNRKLRGKLLSATNATYTLTVYGRVFVRDCKRDD